MPGFSHGFDEPISFEHIRIDQMETEIKVIELFTSTDCTFCPKADRVIQKINQDKRDILALSCHVDYYGMDSKGFALEFCSERQLNYAMRISRGETYTPQAVINGTVDVAGYKQDEVLGTFAKLENETRISPVRIERRDTKPVFNITIADNALNTETMELKLIGYKTYEFNGPKKRTLTNVVEFAADITDAFKNSDGSFVIDIEEFVPEDLMQSGNKRPGFGGQVPLDGFAILGNDTETMEIVAAGKHNLNIRLQDIMPAGGESQ